jgi:hypothetical protein
MVERSKTVGNIPDTPGVTVKTPIAFEKAKADGKI